MTYKKLLELLEEENIGKDYYSENGRLIKNTDMIKKFEDGSEQRCEVLGHGDKLSVLELGSRTEPSVYTYRIVFEKAYKKKNVTLINKRLKEEGIIDELPTELSTLI